MLWKRYRRRYNNNNNNGNRIDEEKWKKKKKVAAVRKMQCVSTVNAIEIDLEKVLPFHFSIQSVNDRDFRHFTIVSEGVAPNSSAELFAFVVAFWFDGEVFFPSFIIIIIVVCFYCHPSTLSILTKWPFWISLSRLLPSQTTAAAVARNSLRRKNLLQTIHSHCH